MTAILTSSLGGQIKLNGKRIPTTLSKANGLLKTLKTLWREDSNVMMISGSTSYYAKNDEILTCLKESFPMSGTNIEKKLSKRLFQ